MNKGVTTGRLKVLCIIVPVTAAVLHDKTNICTNSN